MRGRDDETGIDWLYSIKFVTKFLQLYMKICRTPLSIFGDGVGHHTNCCEVKVNGAA